MFEKKYILDRWLVDILLEICAQKNIELQRFSDDWVLRLIKGNQVRYMYGYKFGLNNSVAASIAHDKVATYQLLNDAGVSALPHILVSTIASDYNDWREFVPLWKKVVLKPTHGMGGVGVHACTSSSQIEETIHAYGTKAWCISPLLDSVSETRIIMLDGKALLAFEKTNPVFIDGVPRFMLSRGAVAQTIKLSEELFMIALKVMEALQLRLAAVDIIKTQDGKEIVLEVNEGFSLEPYMRQSPENRNRAKKVYETVVDVMMNA